MIAGEMEAGRGGRVRDVEVVESLELVLLSRF